MADSTDRDVALEAGDGADNASYGRGAKVLSIGIASTGLVTFAYFSLASHVLPDEQYGSVSLLWSILFVALSVMYRPVEQLLARTIADRRARGLHTGHPLRGPLTLQLAFASVFLVLAFALKGQVEDLLDSSALFWVLVGAATAYAASYFARGYFAGQQWFGLYGGLVLFESIARFLFPLVALLGVSSSQTFVAMGILAAPLASLLVVPTALTRMTRRGAAAAPAPADGPERSAGEDGRFAVAVSGIQLAEQTFLNAAALLVGGGAAAGIVFSAFLVARSPLQLFQSVQTSLLPHLAGLEATDGRAAFDRAIRITLLAVGGFALAVAVGLLVLGPFVMGLVFDVDEDWGRVGLAVLALGMGFHLASGTLNQALLARGRAGRSALSWLVCAALFVAWMASGLVHDELLRAEVGYAGATALLFATLWTWLRATRPQAAAAGAPDSI